MVQWCDEILNLLIQHNLFITARTVIFLFLEEKALFVGKSDVEM